MGLVKKRTTPKGVPGRMGNLTYAGSIDTSELKYIDLDEKDVPNI